MSYISNVRILIHTFKVRELFLNFNIKQIKTKRSDIKPYLKGNCKNVRMLICFIFRRTLNIIIDDIIDNGIQFHFPTTKTGELNIFVKRQSASELGVTQNNLYNKDIDLSATDNYLYSIVVSGINKFGEEIKKNVYLNKHRKEHFTELVNKQQLKLGNIKVQEDYYELLRQEYPCFNLKEISTIIKHGLRELKKILLKGHDFLTIEPSGSGVLYIGRFFSNSTDMFRYVTIYCSKKSRIMYSKMRFEWDGYCYFTIKREDLKRISEEYKKGGEIDFGTVVVSKYYDLAFFKGIFSSALFRVKIKDIDFGIRYRQIYDLKTADAELLDVFPWWGWDTITFKNRTYLTLFSTSQTESLQRIYNRNIKAYKEKLKQRQESYGG